jgi:hypothetical protein
MFCVARGIAGGGGGGPWWGGRGQKINKNHQNKYLN